MKPLLVLAFAGVCLAGCQGSSSSGGETPKPSAEAPAKKADEKVEKSTAEKVEAPKPTAVATAAADPAPADVPTEEDYEEKAESAITATNASDELAKLDKEIAP